MHEHATPRRSACGRGDKQACSTAHVLLPAIHGLPVPDYLPFTLLDNRAYLLACLPASHVPACRLSGMPCAARMRAPSAGRCGTQETLPACPPRLPARLACLPARPPACPPARLACKIFAPLHMCIWLPHPVRQRRSLKPCTAPPRPTNSTSAWLGGLPTLPNCTHCNPSSQPMSRPALPCHALPPSLQRARA